MIQDGKLGKSDEERWDEIIAGCRILRARRERELAKLQPSPVAEPADQETATGNAASSAAGPSAG